MNEQDHQLKTANFSLAVGSRQLEWGYAEVALKSVKKALMIFQAIGDFQGQIKALNKLGDIHFQSNQYNEALECYKKSLNLNQEQHNELGISKSFIELGFVYQSLKDFTKALECYQRGLTIILEENEPEQALKAWSHIGNIHCTLGNYDEAIDFFQQGLLVSQRREDLEWKLIFLDALGKASVYVGDYDQAIQYHEQCLFLSKKQNYQDKQIHFLGYLGNHYGELEDYEKSIQYYRERILVAGNIRYKKLELLANFKDEYSKKTLNYYQGQLNSAQQEKDRETEKICLENLAIIYEAFAEYTKLLNCYKQQLEIAEITGDRVEQALLLFNLDEINFYFKNYVEAIDYNYQGLKILWASSIPVSSFPTLLQFIAAKLVLGISLIYFRVLKLIASSFDSSTMRFGKITYFLMTPANLGDLHLATKYYGKAISYYKKFLNRSRQLCDLEMEALALAKLGEVYRLTSEFSKAIEYYNESIIVNEKTKDYELKSMLLAALGSIYFDINMYEKSIAYFEQSVSVAREFEDFLTEIKSLMFLGNISVMLDKHSNAINYFEEALDIANKHHLKHKGEIVGLLVNLHNCYLIVKNYQKSIECGQEALKYARQTKNNFLLAAILGNIANAYVIKGNIQQAFDNFQECLRIAKNNKDPLHELLSLSNLGLIYLKRNNFLQAEKIVNSAIQIVEHTIMKIDHSDIYDDAYKIHLFEQQLVPYYLLQIIFIKQNKIELALEISERSRARILTNILSSSLLNSKEFSQIEFDKTSLNDIKFMSQKLDITFVEYSIIPAENLVGYDLIKTEESEILIWVVAPSGQINFRQVSLESLQNQNNSLSGLVREARAYLSKEELAAHTGIGSLETLYQLLIAPIEKFLPQSPDSLIIFVPHKSLFLVPFSALRDGKNQQFLLEKHNVSIIPSIQVLNLMDGQREELKSEKIRDEKDSLSALIVGNPKMPTIPLTEPPVKLLELPWSETEVKAIAPLLQTQPITGAAATKVNIVEQMPKARLIHLATHGLLDDIRQLGVPGAIALAPSDEDNGFLTAGEIYNMKLNAELVVLSACSTGQGKITGDGVIGLSRCLIAAGVKSVIVSLWSVGDLSTAFLMVKFYQIFQQGVVASIALNEAQRWLLEVTKMELEDWIEANRSLLSPTLRMGLRRRLHQLDDNSKPFQHPRHWAAFSAIGQ